MSYFSLHCGDAVEFVQEQPPGSVHMMFMDPAYESLEKHRTKGTTTRLSHSKSSSNDWFEIFRNERFPALFEASYRALTKDAHLYVMCDQETMFAIKPMGEAAGFRFWKPVIWDKCRIGMGYHYRCRYEVILFFEKGKRRLTDLGMPDVLEEEGPDLLKVQKVERGCKCERPIWTPPEAERSATPRGTPKSRTSASARGDDVCALCGMTRRPFPTEKPVPLIQKFVLQSSAPEEVVLDPFMGSGSTGEAALSLGRCFLGNDLSMNAVDVARARLSKHGFEIAS